MRTKQALTILASTLGLGLTLALLAGLHTARAAPTATDRFVTPTGSGNACSQAEPCALQTALGLATNGDTIYVAGGVYTGTGSAVITLTKSITLAGGWNGEGGDRIVRDPAAYPTTLDGEWARRVVYISGNITPTLDGFIVTRGNATGLMTATCSIANAGGCGGGIFVRDAHPLILNNTITNNVAVITTGTVGYGGGLYLLDGARVVIRYNLVISNAGSTAEEGRGGGMYLWGNAATGIQVQFNQVLSNAATTVAGVYGYGGGIWGGPNDTLIQGNVIAGNRTSSTGIGIGAGLYDIYGSAHYLGNLVQGNTGGSAVELWYSLARLESNRVVDNATNMGISLYDSGDGPTLVNNVVARSGSRAFSAYGEPMTATLIHNTFVGAGSGYGVYADKSALYLTNTIVASVTSGIYNFTPASATVTADHTLFWAVTDPGISGTNPLSGDPRFVDPAGGDYHIGAGSAALDVGATTAITTDIDGDPRPIGPLPDVGADERRMYAYLPLVLRGPEEHPSAGFWPDD